MGPCSPRPPRPPARQLASSSGQGRTRSHNVHDVRSIFRSVGPALGQYNGASETPAGTEYPIGQAEQQHADEHDAGPVEILGRDGRGVGPEAPEESVGGVQEACHIDGHAPTAQAPARARQAVRSR